MAFVQQEDQQTNFKHYCRVCKKGFMCGRALGGHMRAHGMGDDDGSLDEEDGSGSDWEDKFGDEITPSSNKRLYQLRTNPNRLKSFKNCENCGKEFVSWKSFLEHGKCASDDASDFLVSPPESDMEEDGGGREGGWLKRRRSPRSRVNYNNLAIIDEDDILLARCLVQLANTIVEVPLSEPEESCASASREEELRNPSLYSRAAKGVSSSRKGGLFECKACNKVFTSHQALGGHRASHKKVKGCYAARLDQTPTNDDNNTNDERTNFQSKPNSSSQLEPSWPVQVGASRRKSKVHECSICHRVFTSGQALGGHKRCHWITSNTGGNTEQPAIIQPKLNMNLNVPAWASSATRRDPRTPLSFQVSTQMQLRPWIAPQRQSQQSLQLNNNKEDNIINIHNNNNAGKNEMKGMIVNEDEADSEMKLAPKLSDLNELKEMQMGNGRNPSQWLQVGIGSSANEAAATADA